jgi:hypothetical protein
MWINSPDHTPHSTYLWEILTEVMGRSHVFRHCTTERKHSFEFVDSNTKHDPGCMLNNLRIQCRNVLSFMEAILISRYVYKSSFANSIQKCLELHDGHLDLQVCFFLI